MKSLSEYLNESLKLNSEIEDNSINEGKIESEEDFRDAAKAKFEKAFGDELDEKKMNDTIDGILKDNKELVEKGEWDKLTGILNKSFA
jgi:hypothetical protein